MILEAFASDLRTDQSDEQELKKSLGLASSAGDGKATAAQTHALLRAKAGFDIIQMVSEYRALRATVIKLWIKERVGLTVEDMLELIRFNESIDQLLTQSITSFMEKLQPQLDAV